MVSTAGRSSVQISHFVKRNSFKFQYPLCGTEDWCKLHCFGDLNAKELVVLCSTYIHPAAEVGDINKFLQSFIDSTTIFGDLNAKELVVLCSTYIHPAAEVGDINKFLQSFIDSTTLFGDLNAKELVVLCSTYIHPAAEVGDINKFLQSFIDSTTLVGDLNARGELNGQGNRSRAIGGLLDLALSQAMYWPFYSI
jgi:hypothetical protein